MRGVVLVLTGINPTLEGTPTHVFFELSASAKESCETCETGPAAYRRVRQQPGAMAGHNKLICRVCASLVVLVGKPVSILSLKSWPFTPATKIDTSGENNLQCFLESPAEPTTLFCYAFPQGLSVWFDRCSAKL